LHPGESAGLREALTKASKKTQIIVTSHSPELLDDRHIPPEQILAVLNQGGDTQIGPLDAASVDAMRQHLFSAGELLRMNQLKPDDGFLRNQTATQADLFGELAA
jgi:predicted ATPase